MIFKKKRTFEFILNNLKETINNYSWITEYEKCLSNVENQMYYVPMVEKLLQSSNFKRDFEVMFSIDKKFMVIFKMLLSLRNKEMWFCDLKKDNTKIYFENKKFDLLNFEGNWEDYYDLIEKSGLLSFLRKIENLELSSILYGIECGLDSNARKNRTGTKMEEVIGDYLEFYKDKYDFKFNSQVKLSNILSKTSYFNFLNENFLKDKVFDFVIEKENTFWLIECNFFSTSGSKLDSIVGAYKDLNEIIKQFKNINFVWITDGKGWLKTKNSFKEAYDSIEYFYTIYDLERIE